MCDSHELPVTVGAAIEIWAERFAGAGLHFGHGTADAFDEAAALVFDVAGLSHDDDRASYARQLSRDELARIGALGERRVDERMPLPYLTHRAWFAGLEFFVDERVLIPRSPIAELIDSRFGSIVSAPDDVRHVLEIGTGSGCIAVACAVVLPNARVAATDDSPDAIEVARENVRRHGVSGRVALYEADLWPPLDATYDLIIANPPYVPAADLEALPAEYAHEPRRALESGADGLACARRILQDAPRFLAPDGVLILEVGAQWQALERAYASTPLIWLEFERGGEGVAMLHRADLAEPKVT